MLLGVDGISDFNALHSRLHDDEVQLYAFDCLAYDGALARAAKLFYLRQLASAFETAIVSPVLARHELLSLTSSFKREGQCLHSAEADVRPPRGSPGLTDLC